MKSVPVILWYLEKRTFLIGSLNFFVMEMVLQRRITHVPTENCASQNLRLVMKPKKIDKCFGCTFHGLMRRQTSSA